MVSSRLPIQAVSWFGLIVGVRLRARIMNEDVREEDRLDGE